MHNDDNNNTFLPDAQKCELKGLKIVLFVENYISVLTKQINRFQFQWIRTNQTMQTIRWQPIKTSFRNQHAIGFCVCIFLLLARILTKAMQFQYMELLSNIVLCVWLTWSPYKLQTAYAGRTHMHTLRHQNQKFVYRAMYTGI